MEYGMSQRLLIVCKDVSFRYEGQLAVSGITCAVEEGDYLCIVGENGSGKSTLVRGMLGLLKPSEGSIAFAPTLRPFDVGYLPQQSTIQRGFPASVREVVLSGRLGRLGLSPLYTRRDRAAAHGALDLLGISGLAKAGFSELSGGQQQRVLLARALCAADDGLKILILDEPMNGLDPHVKQEMYACITGLNERQGIAVVMVTHDVQTAVKFARHILVLNGRQEFFGTAHDFEHTAVGADLLRDSCGGTCAVCGLTRGEG
jgi:zinc transport system ATP-binding protein